jgi:RNA polymerase sigma factor (sigma-70 family)
MIAAEMTKTQNDKIQEVVRENGSKLLAFIRSRVNGQEEAEDIFQDVMYELTESYRIMQPIEKMAAWLFRVARNKITDNYRKKRPLLLDDRKVYQGDDNEDLFLQDLLRSDTKSPDRDFDLSLIQEALEMALDELPAEQRDVFIWHELEGLSFREISEKSGQPLNTLLSRKRYAVMQLREKLQYLYKELFD